MSTLLEFLDAGTAELGRAFEHAPEVQHLLSGNYALAEYRRLLERLRRGFAVIELHAFENLPDTARQRLAGHRSTWRLSHDIGLLGGVVAMPARAEDIENAGALASRSTKLGAHFAMAQMLETMSRARGRLEARFGAALVSCLLFNGFSHSQRRFGQGIRQVIEQVGGELDRSEALAGARRTFRTIRHAMVEQPAR